jgi:uncharacterized tannase-like protein DUF6351
MGRRRADRQCRRSTASALRAGKITPAQFVDLNAKIGGLSVADAPSSRNARAPMSRRSLTRTAAG